MRLRHIILILSLLAFGAAATGGYLFHASLKSIAFREAERHALVRLAVINSSLSTLLTQNIRPVRTLADIPEIKTALLKTDPAGLAAANRMLDLFRETLDADVCYLLDPDGTTVASSNRNDPDSFVGQNFRFRPYYQKAIQGLPSTYLALGTTSGKRGAYVSYPVYGPGQDTPAGIAVIKSAIYFIEKELGPSLDEIVMVTDPKGVVFISNKAEWRYKLLRRLSNKDLESLNLSRQFGTGPWQWTGIRMNAGEAYDQEGTPYIVHQTELTSYPGWQVIHMRSRAAISRTLSAPLIRISGIIIVTLTTFLGAGVFFLYRKASQELAQRRSVEKALRDSEARYRSLYHNTPAMLHSIDTQGRIISVSDYWSDSMGYRVEEVVGRPLADFFTETSRRYYEETVFPGFFKTGYCKDVPYQFKKKTGEVIDVLLSAIAEFDADGRIRRTLAVSIDVTERIKAEIALRQAKETLDRYSQNLERQVRKRTREISNILKYTPDMVYMKDLEGRYVLINTRLETLLGMSNEAVRGKTDKDILPDSVARQFQVNEARVLATGRPVQVEERLVHGNVDHTYLSVKFPIFDDSGQVSGICNISTDITAEKKAQERLRKLSGSILQSQEAERSAIARELHDELGQVLTALRMDAVWMNEHLKKTDPRAAERAMTMTHLIDKNIEDVRGMAIRLRPGVLDDLGLVDALEWITTDFERRAQITCVFEHQQPIPPLSNRVATVAYRIAQEALTNVVRHAAAGRVDVKLELLDGTLVLTVADDGKGFDPTGLTESEGLGLAGMRERAALVGGNLDVVSAPQQGTQVRLQVLPGEESRK
ncbi:MAG: PAS domain-containing protein [Pseudomonadota bacterium]